MDKIAKAKKLLRMGIDMGDDDLIMMAHEILGINGEEAILEESPDIKEEVKSEKQTRENVDFNSFTMNPEEDNTKKNGIAVNKIKREIQFIDDGSDKHVATPEVTLAQRKRKPFKMLEQTCQKCGKTVITHPSHKREWFVCDRCIKK